MISLSSEMTDSKGRNASRGWIFFDRDCRICTSLAARFCSTFEKRGFGLAALQDARVSSLLGIPPDQLLREMRVITTDTKLYSGAEAVVFLAKQIWWAYPFYLAAQLPGMQPILRTGYRWFADHRNCSSGTCSVARKNSRNDSLEHSKGESR
jgi:predicted DCC family thiol-disulfide oxidoreductase YuxK